MRNRKGSLPHIVVVTGAPMPSRIASIALGTGDIDCVYHFALHEMYTTLKDGKKSGHLDMLFKGKRLRDIPDLPRDLPIGSILRNNPQAQFH